DLLTPRGTIEKRLRAAGEGDFIVCLYNPSSVNRSGYLEWACRILMEYKDSATVCGLIRQIGREGEEARILSLSELCHTQADMFTTVIIGNK
ncbi:precorrin-3B C(17)-methyltransferase, partial [Klebsiella oxytoca]